MVVDMERAMSFVNRLIDMGLVNDINDIDNRFDPWHWFKDHKEDFVNDHFEIYSGACKGVIVFDAADYVIKFDYCGSESYCEIEANNYKYAVEAGLAHYFAETRFLTKVDGITFTIQERCVCNEDEVYDSLHKYVEETDCCDLSEDDVWSEVDEICEDGRVHYIFDDEALNSFISRNYINDLHQGNFGFVNGRLVIIDFSGF